MKNRNVDQHIQNQDNNQAGHQQHQQFQQDDFEPCLEGQRSIDGGVPINKAMNMRIPLNIDAANDNVQLDAGYFENEVQNVTKHLRQNFSQNVRI